MVDSNFNNQNNVGTGESELRLRQWYYPLWFSLLSLGAGIYLILNPTALFITLSYLIGAGFILLGFRATPIIKIFYLGTGLLFFLYPSVSLTAIPFLFGIFALLLAISIFFIGRKLPNPRRLLRPYKWFLTGGVALIIAYFAFTEPEGFSAVVGFWAGVFLLVLALVGVVLACFLRRLKLRLQLLSLAGLIGLVTLINKHDIV